MAHWFEAFLTFVSLRFSGSKARPSVFAEFN